MTVQAEQMKVCMLKSLLLYASSSFKFHTILWGGGRGEASSKHRQLGGGRLWFLPGRAAAVVLILAGNLLSREGGGGGGGGWVQFIPRLSQQRPDPVQATSPQSSSAGLLHFVRHTRARERRRAGPRFGGLPQHTSLLREERAGRQARRAGGRIRAAS